MVRISRRSIWRESTSQEIRSRIGVMDVVASLVVLDLLGLGARCSFFVSLSGVFGLARQRLYGPDSPCRPFCFALAHWDTTERARSRSDVCDVAVMLVDFDSCQLNCPRIKYRYS